MTDRPDRLFTMSAAQIEAVKRRMQDDPEAIWPAVMAALCIDVGDTTARKMLDTIREVQPCTP